MITTNQLTPMAAADRRYQELLEGMRARVSALAVRNEPMFTTDADRDGVWQAYLDQFVGPGVRQHYNCSTCAHFLRRYATLVTLSADGVQRSALWPEGHPLASIAEGTAVNGVFVNSEEETGTPRTGEWSHYAFRTPNRWTGLTLTAGQRRAVMRENFRNVCRALGEFTLDNLNTAVRLLEADALYRSEKVLGAALWLRDLKVLRDGSKNRWKRDNIVWRAIATAPDGFCHPRSSMIGTLLEDIEKGKSFDDCARAFKAKMHPLQYQRPTAAPKEGAIQQAEVLFNQLGLAPALGRRLAKIEEIPLLWEPHPAEPQGDGKLGLFAHLREKEERPDMTLPAVNISVEKFVERVIPSALELRTMLGHVNPIMFITTAVDPGAPRLFHWNHQFSHYVYHGGTPAPQIGVEAGWHAVAGITRIPARWNDETEHKYEQHGDGLVLLLADVRETRGDSLALFPECLRSELHGVRSVIEAHSRRGKMQGVDERGIAAGLDLRKGAQSFPKTRVKVRSASGWSEYLIDRWE